MWILFLLLMTGIVNADNIYYNKNTGQVMTITKDPVILSSDDQKVITSSELPKNFDINTLSKPLSYYNYDGKKINLNTAMVIADDNSAVALAKDKQDKETAKASVIVKLKTLGLTDDDIKVILR